MRNKIITNTIIFALIVAFISIFSSVFGDENMLVGVGIITIALVLVERDLTIHPVLNTLKLLGVNLILGGFAYLSQANVWLGIPLNFLALFFIGYIFSYNLRKSVVLPFGLNYLFMLYVPVEGTAAANRILALVIGTIIIMAFQFLFNKNKYSKVGIKGTEDIYRNILLKIEDIKHDRETIEIDEKIQDNIKSVKKVILDKRAKDFYLTNSGEALTDVIWTLERISILLDESKLTNDKEDYNEFLNKLHHKLENLLINKENTKSLKEVIEKLNLNCKYINEFDGLIDSLNKDMEDVLLWDERGLELTRRDIEIPRHFNKMLNHKKDFSLKSLRFSFGLRLGIVVSLVGFITSWFNLADGKWMAFTAFVLIQPYYENCKTKAKHRVQGTLIGALIVFISFNLIENTNARLGVVLLAGYLNPFFTNYRNMSIVITVSAVASAALAGGTNEYVLTRIAFVLIGTMISLVANRFILPFKIEDGKKSLVSMYDYVARQMIRDIRSVESTDHSIKSLFLVPSLIEDRMNLLNFGADCKEENEFMTNRRVLINNIYKQYVSLEKNDKNKNDMENMIKQLEDSLVHDLN